MSLSEKSAFGSKIIASKTHEFVLRGLYANYIQKLAKHRPNLYTYHISTTSIMNSKKHQVVIVGGGFGGVKSALRLAEDGRFHITLISDSDSFDFHPALYRTATGGKRKISSIPLSEVFNEKRITIVRDKAVSIDRKIHSLKTKNGQIFSYDALILSIGLVTNYFGINGLSELSYSMKSLEEAEEIKNHLHKQLFDDHRPDLSYVIIGGGPTGVELAGALPAYLKQICIRHGLKPREFHIDLVEAAPRLLPNLPKDLSAKVTRRLRKLDIKLYLKTPAQAQTIDSLIINGKPIRSHTVIWTAGVANNPFFTENQFQLASNKKVRVDQYLQAEPGIYVIGDSADTPYSGMAQTALHDAVTVTNNLIRLADKKLPLPYAAKKPIYITPVGKYWAAVLWGNIRLYGKIGWILRRLADLIAYHDFQPWLIATKRWLSEDDEEESCPQCADNLANSVFLATKLD